jgi:hypothetical protein
MSVGIGPRRAALAALLLLLPLGVLAQRAISDPDVHFLVPRWGTDWVIHRGQALAAARTGRVGPPRTVEFTRQFALPHVPPTLELRLLAFGSAGVSLNGVALAALGEPPSWKQLRRYDLAAAARTGDNLLRVSVRNEGALAALRVDAPAELQTSRGWRAAFADAAKSASPVAAADFAPASPGPLQRWRGWRWLRWGVGAWLLGVAGAGVLAIVRGIRAAPPARPRRDPPAGSRAAVPALLLAVAAGLQLANAAQYPVMRSEFDWAGHVDYVERLSASGRLPLAGEGWQTHQLPLYYVTAALLYTAAGGRELPDPEDVHDLGRAGGPVYEGSPTRDWVRFETGRREVTVRARALRPAQLLGAISSLVLAVSTWLLARRLTPDDPVAQWLALAFAAFLPALLVVGPTVSNEVFSAAWIAALVVGLVAALEGPQTLRRMAGLGALAGLALLSKLTALFAVGIGTLVLGWGTLRGGSRRAALGLAVWLAVAGAIGGGPYLRSWIELGHPLPTITLGGRSAGGLTFQLDQVPTYRTLGSYADFGDVFFHHPRRASRTSWPDGIFASLWSDAHANLVCPSDPDPVFWMGLALILAALPAAAIALGLLRTAAAVFRRPEPGADLLMLGFTAALLTASVLWSLRLPHYSAIKAHYLLSLVPILGVYLVRGRALLDATLPWAGRVLDVTLVAIAAISLAIYRYAEC